MRFSSKGAVLGAAFFLIYSAAFGQELSPAEKAGFERERETAMKNPYANDLGPDTIDVSGYPSDVQDWYKLLQVRCARCHTPARPLNSEHAESWEWERYVKKMMRKPGSGISGADGRKIYEFLVHDSRIRKLDRAEAWAAYRAKLLDEFKKKYPARYDELYGEAEKHGTLK